VNTILQYLKAIVLLDLKYTRKRFSFYLEESSFLLFESTGYPTI